MERYRKRAEEFLITMELLAFIVVGSREAGYLTEINIDPTI